LPGETVGELTDETDKSSMLFIDKELLLKLKASCVRMPVLVVV